MGLGFGLGPSFECEQVWPHLSRSCSRSFPDTFRKRHPHQTACAKACKRARAAFFSIRGSFYTLTEIFIHLYLTLVRPYLDYANQASSPYLKKDIDHLERLQRLATRMVKGCRGLSCEERLEKLISFSLARRRL